jgi:hypothetical protein
MWERYQAKYPALARKLTLVTWYSKKYLKWCKLHHFMPLPLPMSGDSVAHVALFALNHKRGMNYTENMGLRMWGITHRVYLPYVPKYADCSSFATWCYFACHLPDPNGPRFNYNGYGYGATLRAHGKVVSAPKIGDLVFYCYKAKSGLRGLLCRHVAVYVGNGKVVSFGQQGGPYLWPVHYRSDIVEYCRYI